MRTRLRTGLLCAAALAGWAPAARADVVDVNSTTMLNVAAQPRDGTTYRIAPAYELLTLTGDAKPSFADDLRLVVSAWGDMDLGSQYQWDNGHLKGTPFGGDLDLAYVQADFLGRSVQLRVGRMMVAGGDARVIQLDGGQLSLQAPVGPMQAGLTGYVGRPVAQRFSDPTQPDYNPIGASLATGGRAFVGLPGWFEAGASVAWETDNGDPSRQNLGADLRVTPMANLDFLGNAFYDLYESRWGEISTMATYRLTRDVQLSVDWRHVEPDLFLARDSILAVFAMDRRNQVGGIVAVNPTSAVTVEGEYQYLMEDYGVTGNEARLRATWKVLRNTTVGAEGHWLDLPENGYVGGRVFGTQKIDRVSVTLDVQDYHFSNAVNGVQNSFVGTATVGYQVSPDLSVLVAGRSGVTPYLSSYFDAMAKLVYTPTVHLREVR